MMFRFLMVVAAVWASVGLATAQDAADNDEAVQLGDVVVTASREERAAETVPASVLVINRDDIAESVATNVPALLEQEAGIIVRDFFGNAAGGTVDIGGFGEAAMQNVVVLVDGVRASFADLGAVAWSSIPLNQIERIEVIRGGAGVLHGANATGGVINIITRAGGNRAVGGRVEAESFGMRQDLWASGQYDALGFSLTQGYVDSNGYRENNDYEAKNLHAGFSFIPENSWYELQLRAGVVDETYGLPGALLLSDLQDGSVDRRDSNNPDDYTARLSHYLTLTPTLHVNDELRLQVAMSWRERDVEGFIFGSDFASRDIAYSVAPQIVSEYELFGRPNTLVAGVDFYHVEKHSIEGFSSDSDHDLLEFFIHNSLEVIDDVYFDLGYRRGNADYLFEETVGNDFDLDAYRAGLAWNYRADSKLFALYDRSYRVPALDEYYSSFGGLTPGLEPQISETFQLGNQHRFSDQLLGALTLFHIDTQDEIFFDPGAGANANYDNTERFGVIAELRTRPTRNLDVNASYTWTDAELGEQTDDSNFDGFTVPLISEHMLKGDLEYRFLDGFALNVDARWFDSRFYGGDLENSQPALDSYLVVDTRLSYTWEWLTIYGGIANITGEEYSTDGFYNSFTGAGLYPMPEETIFGGIEINVNF